MKPFIIRFAAALAAACGFAPAGEAAASQPGAAPSEPLKIVVSLRAQRVDVYRGLTRLTSGRVSTGKAGHRTPAGVYSVIQKNRHHRSNLYNDAPMPFMQRITWSGIALHQGNVPGYPASHGCIRLTYGMAQKLWGMTEYGSSVVVTNGVAQPFAIDHPALLDHAPAPRLSDAVLEPTYAGARFGSRVSPAMAAAFDIEHDADMSGLGLGRARVDAPLRMVVTRIGPKEKVRETQRLLTKLGFDTGGVDGVYGTGTATALRDFARAAGLASASVSDETLDLLYRAAKERPKGGHLFVRRGFRDIYDAPVTLIDPDKPLGTHLFTARSFALPQERRSVDVQWIGLTVAAASGVTPSGALSRVMFPPEVRTQLEPLLTPDSRLIVSDSGISLETGKGTDFIVQPR